MILDIFIFSLKQIVQSFYGYVGKSIETNQFLLLEVVWMGHTFFRYSGYCILAQEGPRDFSDAEKCLYTAYEATYFLKWLVFKMWPKNWLFGHCSIKFRQFLVFQYAIATFIYNLWSNIQLKMFILEGVAKNWFYCTQQHKILMILGSFVQKGCWNLSHVAKRFQGPHIAMDNRVDDVKRTLFNLSTI